MRGDGRLLGVLRDGGREVTDALWAEHVVGWARVTAGLIGSALLLVGLASNDLGRWLFGTAAVLAVPLVARLWRPPLGLALAGDDVLVYTSHRLRRTPRAHIDTVDADTLHVDRRGLINDRWRVGARRVGIYRGERSRIEAWASSASTGRPDRA